MGRIFEKIPNRFYLAILRVVILQKRLKIIHQRYFNKNTFTFKIKLKIINYIYIQERHIFSLLYLVFEDQIKKVEEIA